MPNCSFEAIRRLSPRQSSSILELGRWMRQTAGVIWTSAAFTLAVALGALLMAGPAHAAIIADTVGDFSGTQGANGFTYGYYANAGVPSTFNTAGMGFSGGLWQGPFGSFPHIRDSSQHPANGGISAVRRYTATELSLAALATISGTYHDIDIGGGNSQIVRIFVDSVLRLEDDLSDDGNTIKNYSFQALLTPTSIVDFEADPNGAHSFDTTGLTGTISVSIAAIPEPSTYALMLAGLAFVGWAARARKART